MIDTLQAEAFGPLGESLLHLFDPAVPAEAARAAELRAGTRAIIIGVDRAGALPACDPGLCDALFTTAPDAPRPWASLATDRIDARLAGIAAAVAGAPLAASLAMQVLRLTEGMAFADALAVESLAYSTLLGGAEFRRWRHDNPAPPPAPAPAGGSYVALRRAGDHVVIALAHPESRNGMSAGMRDALFEALAAVVDDPSAPHLRLEGLGACFSTGGDLAEFGQAGDLSLAHAVRTARSAAALLHRLGGRAEAVLHGACIGSGIEIPAAAAHRMARPGAWFQLPELGMGLIPGAGGTVTLPRAIGRHRTAAMVLTGRRVDLPTALSWGLVTGMAPG
jgi:hypothetical protein